MSPLARNKLQERSEQNIHYFSDQVKHIFAQFILLLKGRQHEVFVNEKSLVPLPYVFHVPIKCGIKNKNQDLNVRRVDVIKAKNEFNISCFCYNFCKRLRK